MKKVTRIMAALAAGAMALTIGACGGSSNNGAAESNDAHANDSAKCTNKVKKDGVEKVTVWAWYPSMDKVVDQFNEKHDDVQVCWINGGQGGQEYTKFNTAIKAKSGAPDVIQLEYEAIPQFVAGQEKHLVDLVKYGVNDIKSEYTEGAWRDVTVGGGDSVYAVPSDAGPFVMMYRKDIFDKYGVKVPTTWAEYEEAGKQLRAKGYEGHIGNYQPNGTAFNIAFFAQKNEHVYKYSSEDPTKVGIDFEGKGTKEVMEYWQKLAKEGVVSTDDSFTAEWNKKIMDGSYASAINAAWLVGYMKGISGASDGAEWRMAPAPVWDDSTPMVNQGGSAFAVTDQAKHTEKAAYVAMNLFRDDASWKIGIEDMGNFPTWKQALESDSFKNREDDFFDGQKVNEEVTIPTANGYKGYDFLPFQTYAYDEQTKAFTNIVRKGADAGSTLKALDQKLSDYAKQQGYTVE